MFHHKHLTLEERERILKYLSMGYSLGKIKKDIGRSKSTVACKLKRNTFTGGYFPITADAVY